MTQHPFTTARGKAFRENILIRDLYTCQMCGVLLRRGKTDRRAANVDHIEPIELKPDLTWDEGNCRAVCRSCHAICDSIEKRAQGDLERIIRDKLSYRPVGADGYPLRLSAPLSGT